MAVATHIFFRLSSADAEKIAGALDGGKNLAELLKNLPQRHMVVKSGHHRFVHVKVPTIDNPRADYQDLYNRCRRRWARRRVDVEATIQSRRVNAARSNDEVLNDWE